MTIMHFITMIYSSKVTKQLELLSKLDQTLLIFPWGPGLPLKITFIVETATVAMLAGETFAKKWISMVMGVALLRVDFLITRL
jgi:hypothetical protein